MSKKYKVRLSPSRVSCFDTCSWMYYQQYIERMPNFDNDGSRRGTIVHGLLEHLINPRHRHKVPLILHAGNVFAIPSCARYLNAYAKKVGLKLDGKFLNTAKTKWLKHRDLVSDMIITALNHNFFGDRDGYDTEIIAEQRHTIEKDDPLYRFKIVGIIDKVFLHKDKKTGKIVEIEIVDYKTSKSKFNAKKIAENIQALTYQFFGRKLYPDVEKITFKFLFLRFPKNPALEVPAFPANYVNGFEGYLSYVTEYLEDFGINKAQSNFARFNGGQFLCGKDGFKERYDKETKTKVQTEEPNWKCDFKDPFDYWAVVDGMGKQTRTSIKKCDLSLSDEEIADGFKVVKKEYKGCPAWHKKQSGVKKTLHL